MQNFTFGRKGTNWFLFAFVLLIGSLPSFGQCPTVADDDANTTGNQQIFCDSQEAEVGDLSATADTGSDVAWYLGNSNTPLPSTQLLVNGTTYYAGNSSGTCNAREAVTVVIYSEPAILGIKEINRKSSPLTKQAQPSLSPIGICVADVNDPQVYIKDLRTSADNDPHLTVHWYSSRTSTTELDPNAPLQDNTDYFASVTNDITGCETNRQKTTVLLNSEAAPTGPADQSFCASSNPTLSDIDATGDNRYFATETSATELSANTPLEDGKTYYISSVGPDCESVDRLAVTVTITPATITTETQRFCESTGTGNNFSKPTVADLTPSGTWFTDDTFTTALDPSTELTDGNIYYMNNAANCETIEVTAEFFPTPNAGKTSQATFCENEPSVNLVDYIADSQLGAPDRTGTFSPALSTGDHTFNPADYNPGSYTFTYTVLGNSNCPTDQSIITVTVTEAPNAGSDISESICSSELQDPQALSAKFSSYMAGRDQGGTFDLPLTPDVETLSLNELATVFYTQYQSNPNSTYAATYTVENSNSCSDSADLSVTVLPSPNAGDDGSVQLVEGDNSPIDLAAQLGGSPDSGGIWTDANGNVVDSTFDPATETPQVYTYTVTNGTCEDSATVTVNAPQSCPVVDATTQRFCESIGTGNDSHKPMVSDLDPSGATWYATADSSSPLPANTLLENGSSYFAGNADGTCDNRTEVSVEIFPAPNAGKTTQVSFCSNEPAVNLVDYIDESILGPAQQTGYFTPTLENNMFNPANFSLGSHTFTYTVPGNSDCPTDKAIITVTVKQAPDAGESSNLQLNEGDTAIIDLFAELGGNPQTGGTWDSGDGTFDPATDTPGVFTYTVTSSNACTASATVTVLAPQQDCPTVTNTTQEFCESIGDGNSFHKPMISDLEPADATWYATADSTDPLAASTVLIDGENYFAGVANGTCTARSEVTVTITDSPNAGKTTFITVCSNDEPFDLSEKMEPSILGPADAGGTFSPALASGTTEFNPAVDAGRRYTYTVNSTGSCPSDSAYITVTVNQAPDAGEDINEDFCVDSIDEIISNPQDFLDLYAGDRDTGGTFNPTLDQLAADFNANPYGTFSTTYTVGGNGCTDSATLSVTITQRVPANAGDDINVTFCSTEGVQDLYEYLPENANTGGSFAAPYEDGSFDPANVGTNPINITYTVDETGACVTGSDSSVMTVTVVPGPHAGEDGTITLNANDNPVNLFDSLGGTPDTGGTWTPGAADGSLDPSALSTGTYNYTYTVSSNNGCDDSAVVAVTIEGETILCPEVTETEQTFCESIGTGNNYHKPTVSDLAPANAIWYASADADTALPSDTILEDGVIYYAGNANGTCTAREMVTVTIDDSPNAGATTAVTLCENGDPVDLVSLMNPSILGDADAGGTFSPALASGTTMFDPGVDAAGRYTYRVKSTEGSCPDDTAIITITITPSANAGEDMEIDLCTNDGIIDLSEYLSANADTTGEFTMDGNVLTEGALDTSTLTADDYTVEYNVEEANDCGSDSATFTVHVHDVPAAPDASDLEFCAVNAPTGADLTPSGDDLVWYADAELTTMVAADDALETGDYYVTSTNGDCESDATMINVTVNDPDAPSIDESALDLCEFEDNTIADLNAAINENAEIIWYASEESTTALSTATVLEDGVTYYATLRDSGTGCESARRLAYTVHLKECDLVFPEGISPNGDQLNDEFVIKKIGEKYPNYTIEIYNRWGNVVYKGNASTPAWDGTANQSGTLGNDVLPVGIYFYVVEFNDGETPAKQGKIYLSR